jgi:stage V sporulation protein G
MDVEITEVRIKLMDEPGERLQAFCSITFDDAFVVRDLKIIEGTNGPFVAMPSRKLTSHCPQCGAKNHLRASYCNHCGTRLKNDREIKDADGRAKLYADIAHPINSTCREMIQNRVIHEFRLEQERSQQPGYVSRYDDFDADSGYSDATSTTDPARARVQGPTHEPRAPHSKTNQPSRPPATRATTEQPETTKSDDFGAGIF